MIASSTGGPKALGELIPGLPAPLGTGSLIIQHMPAGFTASLATRLDSASKLQVSEAAGGEALDPKKLYLAPGGAHLRMGADGRVRLSDDAPMGGLRPRADLTITDAAKLFGPAMVLVVLTGMGKDGLEGARAVKAAGGRVLVEAESTCVVYGMPRASPRPVWPTRSCRCTSSPPRSPARPARDARPAPPPVSSPASRPTILSRSASSSVRSAASISASTSATRWSAASARGPSAAARRTSPHTASGCAVSPEELDAFLDRVTINVSHLWRHEDQFEVLRTKILPEMAERRRLKIWSAGCSYGAEAYTIAAICREAIPGCSVRSSAPTSTSGWSPAPAKATSPLRMPGPRRRRC